MEGRQGSCAFRIGPECIYSFYPFFLLCWIGVTWSHGWSIEIRCPSVSLPEHWCQWYGTVWAELDLAQPEWLNVLSLSLIAMKLYFFLQWISVSRHTVVFFIERIWYLMDQLFEYQPPSTAPPACYSDTKPRVLQRQTGKQILVAAPCWRCFLWDFNCFAWNNCNVKTNSE